MFEFQLPKYYYVKFDGHLINNATPKDTQTRAKFQIQRTFYIRLVPGSDKISVLSISWYQESGHVAPRSENEKRATTEELTKRQSGPNTYKLPFRRATRQAVSISARAHAKTRAHVRDRRPAGTPLPWRGGSSSRWGRRAAVALAFAAPARLLEELTRFSI